MMWFYVTAASEHAGRINLSKSRGDQSGYLWDAQHVYDNWHGRQPRHLIGERNRMPLYAGYLALFYDPSMSDADFFEMGKVANIYLSLGLLVVLGLVLRRHLPPLAALNVTAITMFGWFIYKAGYTQSELLFYTLFFLSFLCCWHLLRGGSTGRLMWLAALGGALSGLAYLTKAATPPFLGIFGLALAAQTVMPRRSSVSNGKGGGWRRMRSAAAGLIFGTVFLAVLSPYLVTNKQVFGRYFYNVNSTFYVWYDDWPSASVGVRLHNDSLHWPDVAASELPGARRYWREHTVSQMTSRVVSGLADIASVSYRTYDYLGPLLLYGALLLTIALTRWQLLVSMVRDRAWLAAFLGLYGALYLLATAFYFPISGTGTSRFFLAHLLPFFFVLSHVFSQSRIKDVTWSVGPLTFGMPHFQRAILLFLVLDVAFRTYPRLMTTYGGF